MAYYKWSDELSVNVEAFDKHHRRLVELINELHEAMSKGRGREVVDSVIVELANYTRYHFSEEERLMKQHNHAGYEQHKAEHDAFVKTVEEFIGRLDAGSGTLSISVMSFLVKWLTTHIQKTDKKYSILLADRRVA